MCGIVGYLDKPNGDESLLKKMLSSIKHRGPDASGVYSEGESLGIGMNQLKIVSDIESPMPIPSSSNYHAYNGEIYSLVNEKFPSSVMDEIAYLETNPIMNNNGMFATAKWNSEDKKLYLSRDPLGIKPLYYKNSSDGGKLICSEIKGISSVEQSSINPLHLHECILLGSNLYNDTIYNDIYEAPCGYSFNISDGTKKRIDFSNNTSLGIFDEIKKSVINC